MAEIINAETMRRIRFIETVGDFKLQPWQRRALVSAFNHYAMKGTFITTPPRRISIGAFIKRYTIGKNDHATINRK